MNEPLPQTREDYAIKQTQIELQLLRDIAGDVSIIKGWVVFFGVMLILLLLVQGCSLLF